MSAPERDFTAEELAFLIPASLGPKSTNDEVNALLRNVATVDLLDREKLVTAIAKATERKVETLRKALAKFEKIADAIAKAEKQAEQARDSEDEAEDKIAGKAWRKHFRQGAYLVYTAGGFYAYNGRCWRALDDAVLDRTVINVSDELYPALPGRSRVVAGVRAQLRARSAKTDFFSLRGEAAPLINCANGTLEVGADGSVTLRPHRPEDAIMFALSVAYDPEAACPEFDAMLAGITAPVDEHGAVLASPSAEELAEAAELQRHVTEIMGYGLYARRFLKAFTIWHGAGDNGKSTLFRIWTALVGQPAVASMRLHTLEQNRFALGHLPGKLLLADDDAKKGAKLPDGLIKQISERKLITAETKGKDPFEFVARVFVALLCNSLPELDDTGRAIASRAYLVPFRRSFAPEEQDRHLAERIIADELPGVLNRLLAGLRRVIERQGFDEPEACRELKGEWIGSGQSVTQWLDAGYQVGTGQMAVADLRADYDQWCSRNARHRAAPSTRWLSERIIAHFRSGTERPVDYHRGAGGKRALAGIMPKPPTE